jgi:chitinase
MKKLCSIFLMICITSISLAQQFRVVGYLPSYRWGAISSIDFGKLTHVCYSFSNPDANGNFSYKKDITSLKVAAKARGCNVFASIGGGGPTAEIENTYRNLTKPSELTGFVHKLMNYLRTEGVDGVDIDLEGSLVQMTTYNAFVIELADSAHAQGLEVSAALANWTKGSVSQKAADALDFINLMSYDQTGSWSTAGPHSTYSAAVNDFNYWKNTKAQAAAKIVLGVPFYGYEFKTGEVSAWRWCEIVSAFPGSKNDDQVTTPDGPLYYNGITTIQKKTQFMLDQQGGGIMIWELGQDCVGENSLLEAITDTKQATLSARIEASHNNDLRIFPNPVVDRLNISGNIACENYTITNLSGVVVLAGKKSFSVDVSSLPSGIFFLKGVGQNKEVFVLKFIKK